MIYSFIFSYEEKKTLKTCVGFLVRLLQNDLFLCFEYKDELDLPKKNLVPGRPKQPSQ